MTLLSYRKTQPNIVGGQSCTENYSNLTFNSPRINGKLVLRSNPHAFSYRKMLSQECNNSLLFVNYDADSGVFFDSAIQTRLTNEALARFTGKVRTHNASLGVTVASWRQSKDMLIKRSQMLNLLLDKEMPASTRKVKALRRRKFREARASEVLEGFFGWVPLIADIQDSLGALARDPKDRRWVTSSSKGAWHYQDSTDNVPYDLHSSDIRDAQCVATVSAGVTCTSQNLFLLNRLGLLNLPGVAWDLIPWSFVVNMFTNMGQIVNSYTDFVGVEFDNMSTTFSTRSIGTKVQTAGSGAPWWLGPGECRSVVSERRKDRSVGLQKPTFQFRTPLLDLSLASIAIALLVQKTQKLNRLLHINLS